MNKWYVGCNGAERATFKATSTPTRESHGGTYAAVIGPFVTRRGAEYMARHGGDNPLLQHVNDAERYASMAHCNYDGPEPRRCALCGEYKVFEAGADEDGVCNDCPKEV